MREISHPDSPGSPALPRTAGAEVDMARPVLPEGPGELAVAFGTIRDSGTVGETPIPFDRALTLSEH